MTASGDDIGARGEILIRALITKFDDHDSPRFRPVFLGDKHPDMDFLVCLNGNDKLSPFFFAQIKATRQGYRPGDGRLKIRRFSRKDLRSIARYPAPTYLFGIDEREECGFILTVSNEEAFPRHGFPTEYPLNAEIHSRLWKEVNQYWNRRRTFRSRFTDPGLRA